jgi:predicted nucleotidyltransferase
VAVGEWCLSCRSLSAPWLYLADRPAITKNGLTRLSGPPPLDLSQYQSDKKIEDEEVLKILEQPLARNTGNKKSKNKKKKTAKKEGEAEGEAEEEEAAAEE